MGSHKHKKKYESDSSSSESDETSSSSDTKSKSKKHTKKYKHSSSEESEDEKSSNSRTKRNIDESDREKHKKQRRRSNEPEDKIVRKSKERDQHSNKYEGNKYEEQHKSRHKSSDRDREKSRDKDVDALRNKRDYNNRERYDDRDRNRRQDNKKDDRRSFRDQRDSRVHRFDNGDHRGRDRFDNRGRRDYNRYGNRGRRSSSFDHGNAKWGKSNNEDSKSGKKEPQQKEKPNFGLSGKLTEETNTYKGVVIKYSEPPEARKPRRRWRLYPFKGEKALQTLYIHRESAYLIGRERKVVDLPVDHPSCSKQHAALQYRLVPFSREDGSTGKRVRPYIIDLESANGTFINNKKIDPKKYVELLEKDVIKFGFSSREYVLLHENSKDEAMDDDVKQEEEEIPVKEEPQ